MGAASRPGGWLKIYRFKQVGNIIVKYKLEV